MVFDGVNRFPWTFNAFSPEDDDTFTSQGWRTEPTRLKKPDEIIVAADGSGDFLTIAEGLTELGSSKGTIRVLAGTYTITSNISLGADQGIMGSCRGTIIATTSNITCITLSGNRSMICDVIIDGNVTGSSQKGILVSGDECVINNCKIKQMGGAGVDIDGDRCYMSGSVVEDCVGRSVDVAGSNGTIIGCNLVNTSGTGNDGLVFIGGDSWTVVGNRITDHAVHGIELTSSSFNQFVGNYIFSNGDDNTDGHGIDINGTGCNENIIVGNHIGTNDGDGINIDSGASKNTIVGNIIQNNEDADVTDNGTSTKLSGNVGASNSSATHEGAHTFNDLGADVNFRIESDGSENMFNLDGGIDSIGINIDPTTISSGDQGVHNQSYGTADGNPTTHTIRDISNTSDITSSIPRAAQFTFNDTATHDRLSAQLLRFAYNKTSGGGVPTAFDAIYTQTPTISVDALYTLKGMNLEAPSVAATKTLTTYVALDIGSPGGAGTITNNTAISVGATAGGCVFGNATGGNKGNGTANFAADIYKNNTAYTNPDYVLEKYYTGKINKYKDSPGAKDYVFMTLPQVEHFTKKNNRLPGISDEPMGMFERGDKALEKIEELFLHVIELNKKIEKLEKNQKA